MTGTELLFTGRALARRLGIALRARRATIATAESCTGGLIGALLTSVPGSSDYYLGGVVSYANTAKTWAGVQPATLARFGAVSGPTAREMALGIQHGLGADLALAVTGVAGPGGGTAEKPVGLVYIGLATPEGVSSAEYRFRGHRDQVRTWAALAALRLALRAVSASWPPQGS